MPTDAGLLANVPFFKLLDDDERSQLASALEVVRLPTGTVIFEAGDPGDSLYVVRDGVADISITDATGDRIVLETVGPGRFFGEISLLDNGPRTATVVVTEELEALRVARADLERFLHRNPSAALDLLTTIGHRLRETSQRLRYAASRNVHDKAEDSRTRAQRTVDRVARSTGQMPFLVGVALFVCGWVTINLTLRLLDVPFRDDFPFGVLANISELTGLFLTIFLLVSANWEEAKDRARADIEYEVSLKTERELAHLHEKVDAMNARVQARINVMEQQLETRLDGIERALLH